MKSPAPTTSRGNGSSGHRSTPESLDCSPTSGYTSSTATRRNPVAAIVGIFTACFSPPDTNNSKSFMDSEEFKSSSVASEASRSESSKVSGSSRGINISLHNSIQGEPGIVKFTMEEIFQVTRNFSPSFKIGQGGFGTVYKAKLLNGTVVAVKRAKKSVNEKHLGVEFQREVQTLSRVEHLNLVKFYGYLEQGEERIVVMEYVPNGTLREHLDCIHGSILDLASRLDIATDVAHAITYLHMYIDRPIIHRDIKSSNILLTENLRAKVTDFGFSRQAADIDSGMTHVSTQVKGTAGYLDPEYLRTYQLTEKSDVYSFGVLLVELVTARRPIEPKFELKERITAKWAMQRLVEGEAISALDPKLDRTAANSLALEKIFELALQCLAPQRQNRPNMKKCAEILWTIRKHYRELSASEFRSLSSISQRSASTKE
ncbi:putative protein kinase RLK-Pelle-RLCK-IV family [Lupinus albus]|uniref:non-specific serine/threonine protein kinase n=1 Tax=Lupinus albus TaxID=3870 RepID=A0A6A4P721_LUPAL|nr:putative protein kinase RLK-Pelle-RLCK-IV family [Lupinus albus]